MRGNFNEGDEVCNIQEATFLPGSDELAGQGLQDVCDPQRALKWSELTVCLEFVSCNSSLRSAG